MNICASPYLPNPGKMRSFLAETEAMLQPYPIMKSACGSTWIFDPATGEPHIMGPSQSRNIGLFSCRIA